MPLVHGWDGPELRRGEAGRARRPAHIRTGTPSVGRDGSLKSGRECSTKQTRCCGECREDDRGRNHQQRHNSSTTVWSSGRASKSVCVFGRLQLVPVACALRGERPSGTADERLRAVSLQHHGPSGPTSHQPLGRELPDRAVRQARASPSFRAEWIEAEWPRPEVRHL